MKIKINKIKMKIKNKTIMMKRKKCLSIHIFLDPIIRQWEVSKHIIEKKKNIKIINK
jgi:hypothetical protein